MKLLQKSEEDNFEDTIRNLKIKIIKAFEKKIKFLINQIKKFLVL